MSAIPPLGRGTRLPCCHHYDPEVVEFVVGLVVGASAATLLLIVIPPWRRVRAEKRLDRDVETRLLLGEDPDEVSIPPEASVEQPRQYTAEELAQLRRLGSSTRRKRD